MTISGPTELQNGPFDVTFAFTESMQGFEQGDVTVGNGSVTAFSGSGRSYTATIEPAGAGTVTVDVAAHVATDATGNPNMPAKRFSVQAEPASSNAPPVITAPSDKSYEQGEAITSFGITVSDADQDTVSVTVTGLPSGLSHTNDQVQGTVAANASAQDYTVTISADDGVNAAVTETFTITVTAPAAPAVTVTDASADEGDSLTFTVTLDKAVSGGFTVTPSFTDATAAEGTDYTENTDALSFAGTKGEQHSFTVETTEDEVVEAGETFTVGLAVSGTTETVTASDTATGTISNDDGSATVSIGNASSTEGAAISFIVTVDKAVQGGFTVTPSFTDGTATEGTDYTKNTAALTFSGAAGEGQNFLVATTDDGDDEPDETFTVSLSISGTSLAVTVGGTATGTILDDDVPALRSTNNAPPVITAPDDKSYEQGEAITAFGITVSDADQDTVSVTVTGLPSGLSYTNGQVQGTVAVDAAIQDYTVTISADDGVNTAVTETFTITVTPHWNRPTVDITGPTTPQKGKFSVRIVFSEQVTGFTQSDVTVGNGAVTYFSGSHDTWSAEITPTASGTVTVDVAANVAEDGVELGNVAAPQYSVQADFDAPTVSISGPTASQSESFDVTITFSEPVTGFEKADVTVDNGAATALSGSGASYTATITPTANGTVTVDVAANKAVDAAGHGNTAASRFSVTAALTRPTVVISGPTNVQTGAFTLDIDFSEPVTGFEKADVTVGNGRVTGWAQTTAGDVRAIITPAASGTVTVDVAANVAVDGDDNGNLAATQYSVEAAMGEPTVTITCPTGVQTGRFTVDIDFSESVTGFEQADVTVGNGRVTGWAETNGDTLAIITPSVTGTVTVSVAANVAVDNDGFGNFAAQPCSVRTDLSSAPAVTIADASAAEGDTITFTVTLDEAVSGGFTVTPGFTDGTAAKSTDYTANTGSLNFAGTKGETKTFTVATSEDKVVELDETFTVALAVSGTSTTVSAGDTATGTITDDDTATVTILDVSGAEGGPGVTVEWEGNLYTGMALTATLDEAVQGGFQLYLTASAGTATSADFGTNTVSLWFEGNAGERKSLKENWVWILQDEIVERTETFNIHPSLGPLPAAGPLPPVPAGVSIAGATTGTIIDDDIATVTIADASALEGDAITFTATVDKAVVDGFTVTPSFTDGTAAEGTDYTENTAGITFSGNAGETQTFTVATTGDADEEANETFTVSLSLSGTSLPVTAADTAVGTIIDDDGPTSVTVTDASAVEGGSMTFTVTLNQAVSGGFTVTPSFTDGTAAKGTDYTENTAALAFAGTAGETKTITVATTEDDAAEPDETFTVSLTVSGTTETVTATDTATGTITNDDGTLPGTPNRPTVAITGPTDVQTGAFTVTITFSESVGGFEQADVTVGNGRVTGFATGTGSISNTLIITPTASGTVTVDVAANVATNATGNGNTAATRYSVRAVLPSQGNIFSFSYQDVEEGSPLVVTVTQIVDGAYQVRYWTSAAQAETCCPAATWGWNAELGYPEGLGDVEPILPPAWTGSDQWAPAGAYANFSRKGETKTISILTYEDDKVEHDEVFRAHFGAYLGRTVISRNEGSISPRILNDDQATITVSDATVSEGGDLVFTVTLNKALPSSVTLTPSYTNGTATADDYTANTNKLTFAGQKGEQKTFTVSTTQDADLDENETFTLGFTVPSSTPPWNYTGTGDAIAVVSGTGTIEDDEPTLTVDDAYAKEGDPITFTVTLDKAVPGGLTVTPSFTDVTATKGTDYTENTAALTFTGTAGETKTFTVATTEDTDAEPAETFTVSLAVSGTQALVGATDTASGSIIDDDGALPAVTIENASAEEGDLMTFTVTLDKAVSGGLTVTPSLSSGATPGFATKGTDYTENTAPLSFTGTAGETKTFTVATTEDADVEVDEIFHVNLRVSGTHVPVNSLDYAEGTIIDDDSPALTIDDASAVEGDSMTFTVTLNKAVSDGVTAGVDFTDGTATSQDYSHGSRSGHLRRHSRRDTNLHGVDARRQRERGGRDVHREPGSLVVRVTREGNRHGDGHDPGQRQAGPDDRRRLSPRGRLDDVHGDAGQGGVGRSDGDAGLHRRDGDEGRRLHGEHGGAQLHWHGGRDEVGHGDDDRGRLRRARRDVCGRPERFGDIDGGDGDRHGDGDDHERRRCAAGREGGRRVGRRGWIADVHGDAGRGGDGGADGDAELHRRDGDEGHGLHGEHGGAQLRGHGR